MRLLWLSLAAVACVTSYAKEQTLWQLGKADHSEHEFAFAPIPSDLVPFQIRVGDGHEEKRWPGFHPGSGNGNMGGKPRPYTIEFTLAQTPRGVYYLNLDLIFRHPRVPLLELDVNGHRGHFYFDPRSSTTLAEEADAFNPIHSLDHKRIALPARFFHAGTNRLTLTFLDEPSIVTFNETSGGSGDSGLYYDALSLSHDVEAAWVEKRDVTLKPTVYYRRTGNGVDQECWLMISCSDRWPGGDAKIFIGDFTSAVKIPGPIEFGEIRVKLMVPDSLSTGTARIELQSSRKTKALKSQSFQSDFVPCRRWKLYYAPHVHLDVGYTDYQAKIFEVHARNLDRLLDVLEQHPDYRFNIDGSLALEHWLNSRSAGQATRLAGAARAGKIGMNAFYANFLTGVLSQEELYRGLYVSHELERRLGIPFDTAWATDVPSYSGAVPSTLASAGIRYFVGCANQTRGPMMAYGKWNHRSPFWWEGADGKRVLAWYSYHYHQWRSLFGATPVVDSAYGSLPIFLTPYERPDYKPDAVLVFGTDVDNVTANFLDARFVELWNRQWAYPQLISCRFSDFFNYIEKHFADTLPVIRGEGGAYWEDGVGSIAQATSTYRESQTRVLAAESLCALTSSLNRRLRSPLETLQRIWSNLLLYGEHTITSYRGPMQPEHDEVMEQTKVKQRRAIEAEQGVDDLMRLGLSQLAEQIPTKGQSLVVYNPLSWGRSGLVRFQLEKGLSPVEVDSTQPVEFEVIESQNGYQTIRFWAHDVPPFGYRVYRLETKQAPVAQTASSANGVIENRFYRITLDPARAAISGIYDKELAKELVDRSSSYRLNEFLYVSGGGTEQGRGEGEEATQLVHLAQSLPFATLQVHQAEQGRVVSVCKTPWGHAVQLTAKSVHTPRVETEILLPDRAKQIIILNRVRKDLVYAKEAVYFAFPWGIQNPTFRFDNQITWVNPEKDLLTGAAVEWFSPQNSVNVENGEMAITLVTLDAPLASLGDINRGRWPERFSKSSAAVYSYAMNNYWFTNTPPGQAGVFRFRYVLSSASQFKPESVTRLGREARMPLEVYHLRHFDKIEENMGSLPAGSASLASVSPDNLVLSALKTSEDGQALVVRVFETAGHAGEGRLTLPFLKIGSAAEANAMEVQGGPLVNDDHHVRFQIQPHQVLTLRIVSR
jgi:hypothetical protein